MVALTPPRFVGKGAGGGFVVVAAEVKKLAVETERATEQISKWVRLTQNQTKQAAEAAAEYYGLTQLERALPPIELSHYGELMYDLWEIQEEVSAKYENCH